MAATVSALYRHPVKGFTPERLDAADLAVGESFPCDRLYAVEVGPSGFDAASPAWVSKMQFAVLARIAQVAKARTAYDEATGVFSARAEGMPDLAAPLGDDAGREALADWLTRLLGDEVDAALKKKDNAQARALDAAGQPIEGLFVAGNDAASFMGGAS
jgi:uncharacterized protein YcbX